MGERPQGQGSMETGLEKLSSIQKVVTSLVPLLLIFWWAGGLKQPYFFIAAIAFAAVAVLLWSLRRVYEGNLYGRAMQMAEAGEHRSALGLLIKAEAAWALNDAHKTPKMIAKDFRRFSVMVGAIQRQVRELGGELDTEALEGSIELYIEIYSNKKNFGLWTSRMKSAAKKEVRKVSQVFPHLRAQFRETCQVFYRSLGDQVA